MAGRKVKGQVVLGRPGKQGRYRLVLLVLSVLQAYVRCCFYGKHVQLLYLYMCVCAWLYAAAIYVYIDM